MDISEPTIDTSRTKASPALPSQRPTRHIGSGWIIRGTILSTAVFGAAVTRPDLADRIWLIGAAATIVTLLVNELHETEGTLTLIVDVAVIAVVITLFPAASLFLFLPWLALQNAAVTTGAHGRLAVVFVGTMMLLVAVASQLEQTAPIHIVVGTMTAFVVALAVAAQVRAADKGATMVRSWLHGRNSRMLDATSEALFVTTAGGEIIQGNAAAATLTDATGAALPGRRCSELGLHDGLRTLDCNSGCALLANDSEDVELWRGSESGERNHLLARATPVHDHRGRVVEVLHSLRDISSLRRATDGENLFLSVASHELKTPLTVIRGFSSLLVENDLPHDKQVEMLSTIHARTTELSTIVERLLLTGRVGSGSLTLDIQSLDIGPILTDRVRALGKVSAAHSFTTDLPAPLPKIRADGEALNIVVDHLLENAVKYSPDGGVVTVSVHVEDDDVHVTVADEGIGMRPSETEDCFKRFWQGDVGERRRFGGTGVGLYVVHEIVTGMGGSVWATSVLDVGTTMHLTLPRMERTATAIDGRGDDVTGMVGSVMSHVGVHH